MHDWRGLPLSAADGPTATAIDDFSQGLLGYEPRALNVLAAADAAPDCPLANAYAAMVHMFAETRGAGAGARPYLERAEAAGGTERERLVTAAARAWMDDDPARAIALGEQASCEHPRELALLKITQYHLFNLGDAPGLLRLGLRAQAANPDVPAMHGLVAFGQEQCHMLPEAERSARLALAADPDEPWSQHALAHVLLTEGRDTEARDTLEHAAPRWSRLNSFMRTHNWWHLALVMIEQGEAAAVLDRYREIWGIAPAYSQDQVGAVSLLARLELAGVDVGGRWQELAPYLAVRVDDHVQPFLSMQYLYGLARADRPEADAMMERVRVAAVSAPAIARAAWAEVAVPACEGLLAHARGNWGGAVERLGAALPRLAEIGGSHAQRDLFHQIVTDSLMRAGRLVAAQQMLELRRAGNPHSRPTRERLARLYRGLDLPAEAERLAERARVGVSAGR